MNAARVSRRALGTEVPGLLPQELAGLLAAAAYPHPADPISLVETPISWVLLAGDFAYKIKRPVRYPFVDQRDAVRRQRLCEDELRLNQRFAPQLYLEVCPIVADHGRVSVRLGSRGKAKVVEYAVRMRRFDSNDELDRQLSLGRIGVEALDAFGRALADMHATLPTVSADSSYGQPESVRELLVANLAECAAAAQLFNSRSAVEALRAPLEQHLDRAGPWMASRRASGCVRECHGDLHSRNIVVQAGRLVPFDCLEYEPAFRWIDVADEIAFLSSDLAAQGYPAHAHAFLAGYLERSGDYHACRLIRLYEAHRALVRAKVAALSAAQHSSDVERAALRAEHERLVAHAAAALGEHQPRLVVMNGLSGAGKTWLARQLARALGAVHLRSDIERKRRAGLTDFEHSGSGLAAGLYAAEISERVYDDLAREGYDALLGGYTVIVDATLLRREDRRGFAELGARVKAPAYLVTCVAPVPVLRERLRARAAAAQDPSEADESVLDWQRQRLEPVAADEPFTSLTVESSDPQALQTVLASLNAPT
ncbi:MAG: bifunctional aminoglycoside phosphotransferase/ATP-binding protein [Steroidobacteraceae bacterium]